MIKESLIGQACRSAAHIGEAAEVNDGAASVRAAFLGEPNQAMGAMLNL